MREFSVLTDAGPRFCLAGLILDVCDVYMDYGPEGFAVGLESGETPPAPRWLAYEKSIVRKPFDLAVAAIPAKARDLWAAENGARAAKLLPFYGPDWPDVNVADLRAVDIITVLHAINSLFAGRRLDSSRRRNITKFAPTGGSLYRGPGLGGRTVDRVSQMENEQHERLLQ
jgi:hypothetical protein